LTFELRERWGVQFLVIPCFEKTGLVKHGFSTRIGGFSEGHYKSLNLGLKKDDDRESVLRNYSVFCGALGIDVEDLVVSDQVHGNEVYEATAGDRGKGIWRPSNIKNKDALMTRTKGVALVTYYADCVPLFFLDVKTPAVALAHAGWRGTVKKTGQKTVSEMVRKFGSRPEDILVGIGPCIRKCCYEVDEPVVKEFKEAFDSWETFFEYKEAGRWMLDLVLANRMQLEEAGIKPSNIAVSDFCTSCRNDLFFSHRADRGKTGSLAAIIELI
jgi:hypothetical protein